MPYGKQQDFDNPTIEDFETKASAQEKRLWDDYLSSYPENFQRSIMADVDHFIFVCPSAGLAVELEKFRHFSDSAGGVSGKKGDAFREMGLIHASYTYREIDSDFEGVCDAIDHLVRRQLSQKSLVDIPKPRRLPLDDDNDVHKGKGFKVTVSGEYKDDEPIGQVEHEQSVATYGGNAHVVNPLKEGDEGYSYTRFNKKEEDEDLPKGNWQKIDQSGTQKEGAEEMTWKPSDKAESAEALGAACPAEDEPAREEGPSWKKASPDNEIKADIKGRLKENKALKAALEPLSEGWTGHGASGSSWKGSGKKIFIASSADIVGDVRMGNNSSLWYQAVIRGDESPVTVGEGTNIQDGCVVHVDAGIPTIIGDGVTIGHNCTIHGCDIDDNVLIGMGSTVLNGAKIAKDCIVGAGSLVTQNKEFPEGYLIFGSPAKAVRKLTEEEIQGIRENAEAYVELMDAEPGKRFYETAEGFIIVRDN